MVVGILVTAIGAVGAFLPVLPTTPFLLIAAACFARSNPAYYERLLENRMFGPYLKRWRHDRTVPREAKWKAYGLVVVGIAISIAFLDAVWLRWTLVVVAACLIAFLASLPTTPIESLEEDSDD